MVQSFLLAQRYFCFPGRINIRADRPVNGFPESLSLSISRQKEHKDILPDERSGQRMALNNLITQSIKLSWYNSMLFCFVFIRMNNSDPDNTVSALLGLLAGMFNKMIYVSSLKAHCHFSSS